MIVAYEKAVYSLNLEEKGAKPQPVTETAEKLPGTLLLLPVGLHNMVSIPIWNQESNSGKLL